MRRNRVFRLMGGIGIFLLLTSVFIWAVFIKRPLPCIFRLMTGLYCPTCGATRAIIHLVNGNFSLAFKYNAFVTIVSIPITIWLIRIAIGLVFDKKEWYSLSMGFLICFLVFIGMFVVFGIARNIPPFVWINP